MDLENEIPVTMSELMELLEDFENYQRDEITSIQHLQRRRRTELLSLRSEALELECRLSALLQQFNVGDAKSSTQHTHPVQGQWQSVASVASMARKEREDAESTNRELKKILSSHLSVFASIRKLLGRNDVLEEIEMLSQTCAGVSPSLAQAYTANSVLAELTDSLERMHLGADSIFPTLDSYLAVTLKTCRRRHEVYGTLGDNCIETISGTPMPCTIPRSGMILWQQLVSRKDVEPDKLYRFIRTNHDTALEMSFTLPLRDEKNKFLCVDAVSAYHKYEEENRFVLVGKMTWKLRAGGLEFETLHWTVISPSPTESQQLQVSIVQSCNRLQVKNLDPTSLQAAHARQVLLTSIGSRLRSFMKTIQNGLLRGAVTYPCKQESDNASRERR